MTTEDPPIPVRATAADDPDFPIAWEPGEAELEWEWDDMHSPRAVPPLSEDYLMVLGGGFAAMYREVGLPFEILTRVWNGFVYYARLIHAPEEERAALRESAPDRWRSMIPRSAAYWAAARRELEAMYAEIEAIRGTEPAAELAAAWERAWQHAGRAWEIHFVAILGPYQVLEDLIERYASIVEGANPADGLELVAGTVEELAATERELATLTAAAAAAPAIADRLRTVPAPTVDEIRALPGGPGFVHQLEDFLSRRGHLGTMCEDLTEPSWNADPRPLLGDIGRRLAADPEEATRRAAHRVARADEREATVRAALAGRPDELGRFEELLGFARDIGWLTEGHNYWIDRMCSDRLRRLTRRVAHRLVADGVIDHPEDVVYLRRAEIAELIERPADRRRTVAERSAVHATNLRRRPPAKVGTISPPDPNAKVDPFEGAHFAIEADGSLRGTGASAGVIRGIARVVRGQDDFDRVRPGDIVVATASNPGWLPLFAIAGGFVTDTGGVLSHAAVVAREFGVPAVVGTREGTRRIEDGRLIEIDGTTGLVRFA